MRHNELRLLIVDDSPEDRTVVRLMLEESPGRLWHITEEEKGGAALRHLEQEQVDCILLDFYLPDMNAVRFLREVTARFSALHIPVVVFTGADDTALEVGVQKAGAHCCLGKKSISPESLIRAIDRAVGRYRRQAAASSSLQDTGLGNACGGD